jgi:uncharacterized membrane-anchored protein
MPANHPYRIELNDEAHARPPDPLAAPAKISYLALFSDWALHEQQRSQVAELAQQFNAPPPAANAVHYSADMGAFRLKWERHSEFSRYTIIAPCPQDDAFEKPAVDLLPPGWISALPGQVIVATHVAAMRADGAFDPDAIGDRLFSSNPLVGADVAGGAATAVTDFRICADGFSRLLIIDRGLSPRQAGRLLQRLLEIDTYRLMAQLAFPIARQLAPQLSAGERELAEIAVALQDAAPTSETELLRRLTHLEASIEGRASETYFRFSAAAAYYQLVRQRIADLRESRLPSLQTFLEFTERRLAPAMNTCAAVAARQDALRSRSAAVAQLLSTRVAITREHQEMALLASMDRRGALQLRLQQAVESVSTAAVSYYVVGLIGHAAEGLEAMGAPFNPTLVMGLSIPFVVVVVAIGMRRIRRLTPATNSSG